MRGEVGENIVVYLEPGGPLAVWREEKGPHVTAEVLGYGLQERCEEEGEVVPRVETMPEGAGDEGGEGSAEAGFFPLGCDAEVHVVAEPVVGVLVPVLEVGAGILRGFYTPWIYVLQAIPFRASCFGINALVSETGEDAGTLGEVPDAVIFHAGGEAEHFKNPDAPGEGVGHIEGAEDKGGVVPAGEFEEEEYPKEASEGFEGGRGAAAGDFALLAGLRRCLRVCTWRYFKHGCGDPAAVIHEFEGWPGKQGRKEEDIASKIEETW